MHNNFKIYNNLNFTRDNIKNIIDYIKFRKLPDLEPKPLKNWINQYCNKPFKIINNQLSLDDHLIIANNEHDIEATLAAEYDTLNYAGIGIISFYKKICNKYIGIKRHDVAEFLKKQPYYQITKPLNHKVNKVIVANYTGERIAIDLIDLSYYASYNNGYKYILSCIDYYSRYCWLFPLKFKTSHSVAEQLKKLFDEVEPKYIMADNGGEFEGETKELFNEYGIKGINTKSYSPQSNGLIENLNKQIRKIIREVFLRTNNLNWVDYLKDIQDNKNKNYNSKIKAVPYDLFHNDPNNVLGSKAKENVIKHANKVIKNNDDLGINDIVRIKMSVIDSNIRKMIKQGDKKKIIINYSPDIYSIHEIIKFKHSNPVYILKDKDGRLVHSRFFASDLQKVDYYTMFNNQNKDYDDKLYV